MNAKKNASSATKIVTVIVAGTSVIPNTPKAMIIVPIAPTSRQFAFSHKQQDNLQHELSHELRSAAAITKKSTTPAIAKAINILVLIKVIIPNINNTPTRAPKSIPATVPINAHPPHTQLSLFVFIFINSHCYTMKLFITVLN